MKTLDIDIEPRTGTGRGFNNKLRLKGMIPAVVYGNNKKNTPVCLPVKTVSGIMSHASENAIIVFKSADKELNGKHVLLKDWDRDIITRNALHMDFYEIDLNKEVRVTVPLHFVGKAKGVAEGGIVSHIARELQVECLPTQIPEFVEVDVSNLGIGDSIHVEELVVPQGVKKVFTENYTIANCAIVKEEVIVAPVVAAEGAAATVAEPEVIAKGKKEEGAEGAAAPAKDAGIDKK